ncbi:MAG: hypothetical protein NTW52_15420 [Planctomycetota bacterium]|nr:hypothetical protein [Planctomycetota bacterium]
MLTPLKTNDDSQLHLESMLYLLEDSVLDRDAFEVRLENDARLAEVLSESVTMFQSLKSIEPVVSESVSRESDLVTVCKPVPQAFESSRTRVSHPRWNLVTCVAASIGFLGFLSWMIFETNRIEPVESDLLVQNSVAIKNIVSAWSELKLDSESNANGNADSLVDLIDSEEELTLVGHDAFSEKDVPDWLVMATVDSVENNIEANDTKVLLQ